MFGDTMPARNMLPLLIRKFPCVCVLCVYYIEYPEFHQYEMALAEKANV